MSMVPKSWAVLSDALDEGCAHAARSALELLNRTDVGEGKRAAIAEAIRVEVLNAITERFYFDDQESE